MATHSDIVTRAGKDPDVAVKLGVRPYQVRDWRIRGRIPAEHWKALAELGLATLEELAQAAAERRDDAA